MHGSATFKGNVVVIYREGLEGGNILFPCLLWLTHLLGLDYADGARSKPRRLLQDKR